MKNNKKIYIFSGVLLLSALVALSLYFAMMKGILPSRSGITENVVDLSDHELLSDGKTVEASEQDVKTMLGDNRIFVVSGIEQDLLLAEHDLEPIPEKVKYFGYERLGLANVENHLNVREKPVDGKLVGKLSNHAACEVLDISEGWAHIKSGKVEGYVSAEYLQTGPMALMVAKKVIKTVATVNVDGLKVREEPNTDCPVITQIQKGEELIAVEVSGGWVKVEIDDEEAYVSEEYVTVGDKLFTAVTMQELTKGSGVTDKRMELVQYAKKFVGGRYVWGGVSLTNGVDCSGFTMKIYQKYGISLPHHAASQANYGKRVTAATIRPGDLVFYSKGGAINHVAIYIGNGQVVHASSPKTGIKISGMYYRTPARMISLLP